MSSTLLEERSEAEGEHHTPEELNELPDGHRYELIDNKLLERHSGARSSHISAKVIAAIGGHARRNKLGKVFGSDCGYHIFLSAPNDVRFVNISFIAQGRLPNDKTPLGHVRIAPDLAVEVVSPNDTAEELEAKRIAFLQAGVRLLWIIYPEARTVHVHRASGHATILTQTDQVEGEDVLQGFTCRVAEFFEGV